MINYSIGGKCAQYHTKDGSLIERHTYAHTQPQQPRPGPPRHPSPGPCHLTTLAQAPNVPPEYPPFALLLSLALSLSPTLSHFLAATTAQAALAQARADLATLAQAPNVPPQYHQAAQAAVEEAERRAAREHLLPLNIAEASPDGQWLAVGCDQLAVVLVPAGAG